MEALMSTLLFCILLAVLSVEAIILVAHYQNCAEISKKVKYSNEFEIKKMETKIEQFKKAILKYHFRIDEAKRELDSAGKE